ncbi:NAD dependent epimerase/dehydratase family [Carpediemonas membranifera]|uniref:NAD dependent epimerase/dehydratase family n=1 Tax=Carpediemonas membranifera TaxID=201153 RepID=A0A8J6E442_9EUKA|nr:NAD dependent epimerase/dehydratase family [Carpediemonas membranifera]|eukprot:KAG9396743.1 NAD dependent epimerase/dehydratase family [Carpediemonas membranifera]
MERKPAKKGKVFVTGGTGFVGSNVVRVLREKGYPVRLLVRATSKFDRLQGLDFETHVGDILNYDSIEAGMDGCDFCLHLACISSWDDIGSPRMKQVAFEGTRNVLNAAKKLIIRFVFVSSAAAVDGSFKPMINDETARFTLHGSRCSYSIAKHEAEAIVLKEAANMPAGAVIVNPGEIYGPDDHAFITAGNIRDMAKDWPVLACTGGTAIVHVDSIARGIIGAMEKGHSGERYILGGPNLTIPELAKTVRKVTRRKVPILTFPGVLALMLVRMLAFLHLPSPVHPALMEYACRYWFVDDVKARLELGYGSAEEGYKYQDAEEIIASVVGWLEEAGHI